MVQAYGPPGEVLVEDGVEVVVVGAGVPHLELAGQPRVAVVRPLRVVVPLPELDRPHIGADEDGAAEEGVEGGGEDGGEDGLQEEHGGVGHGEGLGEGVESRAPVDLVRRDVGDHELALEVALGQLEGEDGGEEEVQEEGGAASLGRVVEVGEAAARLVLEEQHGEQEGEVGPAGVRPHAPQALHEGDHHGQRAAPDAEVADEGLPVVGACGEEDEGVDDAPLGHLGPQQRPLPPHHLGGGAHLELRLLVARQQRRGEALPGRLLAEVRQQVVDGETNGDGQQPEHEVQGGEGRHKHVGLVHQEDGDGGHHAHQRVVPQAAVDGVPELLGEGVGGGRRLRGVLGGAGHAGAGGGGQHLGLLSQQRQEVPPHDGQRHGGVAGAPGQVVGQADGQRAEDAEQDFLGVLGVAALGEPPVGEAEHDDHGEEGAEDAVEAGLQAAAGVAPKHVDVELLQQVHGGRVDLGKEAQREDQGEGEDDGVDHVPGHQELAGGEPHPAVELYACTSLPGGRLQRQRRPAAQAEVDGPREHGGGVEAVCGRAGVRLDGLEEAVLAGAEHQAEEHEPEVGEVASLQHQGAEGGHQHRQQHAAQGEEERLVLVEDVEELEAVQPDLEALPPPGQLEQVVLPGPGDLRGEGGDVQLAGDAAPQLHLAPARAGGRGR